MTTTREVVEEYTRALGTTTDGTRLFSCGLCGVVIWDDIGHLYAAHADTLKEELEQVTD